MCLDTQPSTANPILQPALPTLTTAASSLNIRKMPGIPYRLNEPFQRAMKAITGEEGHYRW